MKKTLLACAVTSVAQLGLTTNVLAHAGHDHGHWSSPAMHALAYAAIIAVAGAGVWALRAYKNKARSNQQEDK